VTCGWYAQPRGEGVGDVVGQHVHRTVGGHVQHDRAETTASAYGELVHAHHLDLRDWWKRETADLPQQRGPAHHDGQVCQDPLNGLPPRDDATCSTICCSGMLRRPWRKMSWSTCSANVSSRTPRHRRRSGVRSGQLRSPARPRRCRLTAGHSDCAPTPTRCRTPGNEPSPPHILPRSAPSCRFGPPARPPAKDSGTGLSAAQEHAPHPPEAIQDHQLHRRCRGVSIYWPRSAAYRPSSADVVRLWGGTRRSAAGQPLMAESLRARGGESGHL
jgi:hypothetical protein